MCGRIHSRKVASSPEGVVSAALYRSSRPSVWLLDRYPSSSLMAMGTIAVNPALCSAVCDCVDSRRIIECAVTRSDSTQEAIWFQCLHAVWS